MRGTNMKLAARLFFAGILGLGVWLGSPASVTAQVDSRKLPAAKQAAASFAERAKGSEASGQVPRMTDPAIKKLLDVIFDTGDIASSKTIPFDQLSPLSERMLVGNQVGIVYMLSGTGSTDLAKFANEAGAADKLNLNVVKYPDEMGCYLDFTVTIQGAIAEVVQAHLASAKPAELARPNFQSGLGNIRGGATRSVSGSLETLAIIGLTNEWIRARMTAITAVAPKLKNFLLAEQKEELRKMAIAVADVTDDGPAKKALQDFARALE
jgi:hypothetical protein